MFALFAGDRYYPSGGWGDYVATFASLDDAYARYIQGPGNTDDPDEDGYVATYTYDWGHVVNMESGNIVARYY